MLIKSENVRGKHVFTFEMVSNSSYSLFAEISIGSKNVTQSISIKHLNNFSIPNYSCHRIELEPRLFSLFLSPRMVYSFYQKNIYIILFRKPAHWVITENIFKWKQFMCGWLETHGHIMLIAILNMKSILCCVTSSLKR